MFIFRDCCFNINSLLPVGSYMDPFPLRILHWADLFWTMFLAAIAAL